MPQHSQSEDFARLIEALDPWLDQIVVIGGCAHRLYRLHPLAQPLEYAPLATLDTDIAVPAQLPLQDRISTSGWLRAGFGKRSSESRGHQLRITTWSRDRPASTRSF